MYYLVGVLETERPLATLAAELDACGFHTEIRHSQHYVDGQYIRILHDEAHIAVERTAQADVLLRADGDTSAILIEFSARFADTLSALDIPHRMELYDEDDNVLGEFSTAVRREASHGV